VERSITAEDYDPLAPEVQADPFHFYRLFQSGCPVHHHTLTDEQQQRVSPGSNPLIAAPTSEVFMVFGHDEIRSVLTDHETFSSFQGGVGLERTNAPNDVGMLIYADPPHHGPQRAIVAAALSPRLVKHMETRIAEYADELIDSFAGAGRVDIVERYCNPLPGLMFCELLGLPRDQQPTTQKWADATVDAFGADAETQQRAAVAMLEMMQYFFGVLASRRERLASGEELPEDLITGLMVTEVDGRCFNDTEIVLAVQLLIAGGNDTTSGALGSGVNQLCRHPDQQRMLRERPELLPGAVEEILRFDAPAHCTSGERGDRRVY
jgi:cytochrome P450